MRIVISLISASLIFLNSYVSVVAQGNEIEKAANPTAFELFWPVSAGKVAGEPLYFLKTLKENLRGMLVSSNFKKAEYQILLSEKRTAEAEKLILEKKDYSNAEGTMKRAIENLQNAKKQIEALQDNPEIPNLQNRFYQSVDKHKVLYEHFLDHADEEFKKSISDTFNQISAL